MSGGPFHDIAWILKQQKMNFIFFNMGLPELFSAQDQVTLPLMGTWVPDLPSGGDKQRFDGERHTDPASDHTDPNPATLAPRLL